MLELWRLKKEQVTHEIKSYASEAKHLPLKDLHEAIVIKSKYPPSKDKHLF